MAGGYIRYVPPADVIGPAADRFEYQVIDDSKGGGSGRGLTDPTPNRLTFDIGGVKDVPTENANTGVTLAEGASDAITAAELDFDDAEQADTEITYTITTAATYGTLLLNGTVLSLNDTFTQDDINNGRITYVHDGSETTSASFGFSVSDGVDAPITGQSFAITITPVNDAPELDLDFLTAGNDATAVYQAGDPPTYLAFDAYFDDDNDDWDGATLTVAISGGTAGDQLTIESVGTGLGEVSLSGSDVLYEGTVVGTWSGGDDGNPLAIIFNADACHCAIELITASILYENDAANPAPSTRDVTFTFVDGDGTALGGSDTATAIAELTVTPAPSPPVIDEGPAASGNEDAAIGLTGITITDLGDPVTGLLTVRLSVEEGTLSLRTNVAGGVTAGQVSGDGSGAITIVATPGAINATLAAAGGLTYLGGADFFGADQLTIPASDGVAASPLFLSSLGPIDFGTVPNALAFADLDGDAFEDYVIGLEDTGGGAGGIFMIAGGPGLFPLITGAPTAFAFGDFDGDGLSDIGFASYTPAGSGYVAYVSSIDGSIVGVESVDFAGDLIAGDFDGNGLTDLAATDVDNGRVATMLQTAAGVFAPTGYSATTSQFTSSIRAADFNSDGVLDLLTGNYGELPGPVAPGSVDLMLGNGDGTFAAATQVFAGPESVSGLAVGDFDNDGAMDFAVAAADTGEPGAANGVRVVLGNGDGTFQPSADYATAGQAMRVVAGDLNNDGNADLVVTNFNIPGTFSVLVGNGDGTFQAAVDFGTADEPFSVAIGDPDGDGDLDLLVGGADGNVEAFNNDDFHRGATAVKTITVNPVDDAPVAQPDAVTTAENAVGTGDVFASNGSGVDADVDGPALSVSAVNGVGANVGTQITLASGALLTLNADGTYSYDPNGAFDYLVSAATATATGAVNDTATDTFTYTLTGGNTVTVTMTVTGVDGAGDELWGDSGVNTIGGTAGNDYFDVSQGGEDAISGLGGSDRIYYGAAFTAADTNDGGGSDRDVVILQGNYTLTLGALSLVNVEYLSLQSGSITRWGDTAGNLYSYDITTVEANVLPGQQLVVNGQSLLAGENFTFDGSAETDGGRYLVYGGRGTDDLTGGTGNDIFSFEEPRWNAADTIDGGAGTDAVVLSFGSGLNTIVFGAGQFTSIESISVNNRFATDPSQVPSYALVLDNGNVAAGATLIVNGQSLLAGQTISIDGSAVVDGRLRLFGGADADVLIGGANDDEMTGKGGADTFTYLSTADSKVALADEILDFEVGIDTIDLGQIDAIAGGADDAFTFIGNTAFSSTAGELRAELVSGVWQVAGDTDGNGIADFLILVTATTADPLGSTDFIL